MSSRERVLDRLVQLQSRVLDINSDLGALIIEVEGSDNFELVSFATPTSFSAPVATPKAKSKAAATPSRSPSSGHPSASPASPVGVSEELRTSAAIETGDFFARCLAGSFHGSSGRSQINLPCNLYVVIQEFSGVQHCRPVLVYKRFSVVKQLVANPADSRDFGNSIFAGFHEEWEAQIAVRRAGLLWPPDVD